jgi:hypothetical protein
MVVMIFSNYKTAKVFSFAFLFLLVSIGSFADSLNDFDEIGDLNLPVYESFVSGVGVVKEIARVSDDGSKKKSLRRLCNLKNLLSSQKEKLAKINIKVKSKN